MRNNPTQRRSQQTLDAIMDAANQLFFKRGVNAATLTDIAEAAQVSIGSLYRFFSNKEALVDEYLQRYLDALANQLTDPLPDEPQIAQLREIIDILLDRSAEVRRKFVGYGNVRVWRNSEGSRPAQLVAESEYALISSLFTNSIYVLKAAEIDRISQVVVSSSYPILELLPSVSRAKGDALLEEVKIMIDAYISERIDTTKRKPGR